MSIEITKASINMFVSDSEKALDFYTKVFKAIVLETSFEGMKQGEKGARFFIGENLFAIADENPEWGSKSPFTLGGTPICIQLYVNDVEEMFQRAIDNGCTEEMAIVTLPNGIKVGNVIDPFGYIWSISKVM